MPRTLTNIRAGSPWNASPVQSLCRVTVVLLWKGFWPRKNSVETCTLGSLSGSQSRGLGLAQSCPERPRLPLGFLGQ